MRILKAAGLCIGFIAGSYVSVKLNTLDSSDLFRQSFMQVAAVITTVLVVK